MNVLKWAFASLFFLAAMSANYFYASVATPVRIIGWIIVTLAIAGVLMMTREGAAWLDFAKEARNELKKVVWAERPETVRITFIVLAMVFFVGILLWGLDLGLMWVVGKVTQIN